MKWTDPSVCAACAGQGPTCCELAPGQEESCFPLSRVEMDRIREFVNGQGWFALEANSAAFVANVCRLFPADKRRARQLFPRGGEHYRLAVDASGACKLLGETGCVLPAEARPYYCRLFPLWMDGDKLRVLEAHCLARRRARGPEELLRQVGLTAKTVHDLHCRLRLAWGFSPCAGEDLTDPILSRNPK